MKMSTHLINESRSFSRSLNEFFGLAAISQSSLGRQASRRASLSRPFFVSTGRFSSVVIELSVLIWSVDSPVKRKQIIFT
jgi:hypothetical protein